VDELENLVDIGSLHEICMLETGEAVNM